MHRKDGVRMICKYKIYADAAADIPVELRDRYGIEVLPIPVTMGERTIQSGVEVTNDEFYAMMDAYDGIPVTSQITPYVFEELFQKELAAGTQDLILLLINSKGSATYFNAVSTRERFYQENERTGKAAHPSLRWRQLFGRRPAMRPLAAQKLEMGAPIEDVLSLIDRQLKKQRVYFGLYSLKYAGKSGRIPSAAVFVGEALGIKPIMQVWDHAITTVGKARGEKKLIKELVKMVDDDMEPNTPYSLVYGSDTTVRDELAEELTKKVGYPPVYQFQIGAAIAINAGPRVVGAIFETARKKIAKEEKSKEKNA